MAAVSFGNTVKVNYIVKLDDGTVVDSTSEQEPFQFTIGMGQAIPGFEAAVIGMTVGETKTVKVDVEDAYGPYHKEMVTEIEKDKFPPDFQFTAGQHIEIPHPDGKRELLTVLKVTEKTVIVDPNHPLAGKNLTIDIKLLKIF